jgi:Mrp family chromosome partitioning ATPase
MSALDQAVIKAYAKDQLPATDASAAVAIPPPRPARSMRAAVDGHAVEQVYRDGVLYRIESPRQAAAESPAIPVPHLPLLPPTSPRRGVRRSMQRLLAATAAASSAPVSGSSSPRVARKVIIRHISHSAAPPPLGLLRSKSGPLVSLEQEDLATGDSPAAALHSELPPETIIDKPTPPAPLPSSIEPQIAPLNVGLETVSLDALRRDWNDVSALPPMVVMAESADAALAVPMALVNVQLQSLEAAVQQSKEERFAGKSLDEPEERNVTLRLDSPAARAIHRPHVRFSAAQPDEPVVESPPVAVQQPESPEVAAELTFLDPPEDLVPSDLVPHAGEPSTSGAADAAETSAQSGAKPSTPVWEVDQFQWPRTCDKLMHDDSGYFAHAGEKLLAAVNDGLRVLAITGTRRGEGRSTLALCLARAAAGAGIQVGVIDADFARPQLASKLGLEIAYGWQDAALGKIPLSEAAIKSLADNITVLPLETSAARKSLSLADPRVTATIRAAAATFELLIVDLSPLSAVEQIAFPEGEACPLDAAIVVRDLRFASATDAEALCHSLQDAGVEAVGIAENFVVEEELQALLAS